MITSKDEVFERNTYLRRKRFYDIAPFDNCINYYMVCGYAGI